MFLTEKISGIRVKRKNMQKEGDPMQIIDAHTHIFPTAIASKATRSIGNFYDLEMHSEASVECLIQGEQEINAEKYLVCSSATGPHQVESINDFMIEECKKNTQFVGLGALHLDYENYEEEIDRILEGGLRGVKFHHDFQQVDIDDPKMLPIYKALAKRGLPVLFHMGDDRYDYSAPARLVNVFKQVPDFIGIAAHFGGYRRWEESLHMPKLENLYFDTSSSLPFIDRTQALCLMERFGHKQFMFGTDFPMWKPKEELKRFLSLDLDENTRDDVLYRNFKKLFQV